MKMNEEMENKIIALVYGELNSAERIKVGRIIEENDEAKRIYEEHKRVHNSVKNLKQEECPEDLIQKVNAKFKLGENKKSFLADLYTLFISRPALGVASAVVIIFIIVSTLFINRPAQYNGYTRAEVELANRQVEYSLAVIGKIFDKTEKTIEKEVLATRVGKPIKEGINLVNHLFVEENKNETSN